MDMTTYFGVLKDGISFTKIKKKLSDSGIIILDYYPKLKIIKFKTEKKISGTSFDFFVTVEEEKNDFFIQS